jgi:hypothetical protein
MPLNYKPIQVTMQFDIGFNTSVKKIDKGINYGSLEHCARGGIFWVKISPKGPS